MSPLLPVIVLLVASSLWGLTWLPLKHFGEFGLRGAWVTLVAHGTVGLLSLPCLYAWRAKWLEFKGAMLLLLLFGGLANLCFASAMVLGDVTRVMVLFYLLPAWGVLGGRLVLGERIDRRRQASLACSLLGAFLVLGGFRMLDAPPSWADVLAVASGFTLACNNVLFRKLHGVPVASKVAGNFVGCLVWAALFVSLGADPLPPSVPGHVWGELIAFGAIWILVATVGTLWSVHHLEAGRSSVLIIMELLTAVVSSSVLMGDWPTGVEWLGGGLVLVAALLEGWRPAQGAPRPSP